MNGRAKDSPVSAPPPANKRRWPLRLLNLTCRYFLAGVFLLAAIPKITDFYGFEDRVLQDSALPDELAWVVVRFLPWLELTCGMCFALGYAAREAGLLAAILLFSFLIYSLLHRNNHTCGCFLFSTSDPVPWSWWHPVRNFLMLISCVPVIMGATGRSN